MRIKPFLITASLASFGLGNAALGQVYGTLGNFDVVNDTGQTAHGFEIDLEGISVGDVHDTFGGGGRGFPPTVERYGAPTIAPTATGVSIIYLSPSSGSSWSVGTPSGTITTGGESCWTGGGLGYGPSTPCDHFGVGTTKTPTATSYKWITGSPGAQTLMTATLPPAIMSVPTPPPQGAQPVVVGHVDAPPPELGQPFGTAEWVKVFTIQYDYPVVLGQLVGNNGIVPQGASEVEVEWQLLQGGNIGFDQLDNPGDAGAGKESVLRRYEFYKYVGPFVEGEATCENPANCPGAVGAFLGDQNLALNVNGYYFGAPVPEPETYTMMFAGLGLLGFFARRRRRNPA